MSTGSQTNSGTTRSDWKRAADSARLSARRRSRRNHTTAVTAAPDTDGSRTGTAHSITLVLNNRYRQRAGGNTATLLGVQVPARLRGAACIVQRLAMGRP